MAIETQDTFATGGRGTPNQWSPASNGKTWTQQSGSSTLAWTSSAGTLSGATGANVLTLGSDTYTDIDPLCHFSASGSDTLGVIARASSAQNYYRGDYNPVTGTLNIVKRQSGTETVLATTNVGTPTTPGWNLHFDAQGASTNNLKLSWWDDNGQDSGWALFATDLSFKTAGMVGVYGKAGASGDVLSYDSFVAEDPSPFPNPPVPPTNVPDRSYGNTYFVKTSTITFLPLQAINDLLAILLGVWLRYQLQWKQIEPNADSNYNWAYLDWAVTLCNSYGINLLWPIQAPPTGYLTIRAKDGATVAAGTGQFASASAWATFVAAVCARYNGMVASPYSGYPMILDGVQFGNEDYDLSMTGIANNQPARDILSQWLVSVVDGCYPIVRTALPNAWIGTNAVRKTPNNGLLHIENWTGNLYSYTGGLSAAWLADKRVFHDFHFYRDGTANYDGTLVPDPTLDTFNADGSVNAPSVQRELSTLQSIIVSAGSQSKVWCTEFGWNLYNASTDTHASDSQVFTPAQDALYRQKVLDVFRLNGGSHALFYTIFPSAKVATKTLPASPTDPTPTVVQTSTEQKSVKQFIGGVYTAFAGDTMLATYANGYLDWQNPPDSEVLAPTSRDGVLQVSGRNGNLQASARSGSLQVSGRSGQIQASGRDGNVQGGGHG